MDFQYNPGEGIVDIFFRNNEDGVFEVDYDCGSTEKGGNWDVLRFPIWAIWRLLVRIYLSDLCMGNCDID